ncbi:hypothetical protein [Pontibacter akesuensis]|uniref:hypothetical protein n=1 Tax=Pontibacter akesuensis TaxID=388950 RepID=UPI0012F7654F|nr:hypothetical protein [Pontibacter akesuensis]
MASGTVSSPWVGVGALEKERLVIDAVPEGQPAAQRWQLQLHSEMPDARDEASLK